MNKNILTLLVLCLIIRINSAFAENPSETNNLTSYLQRLYKLHSENKEYSQFASRSGMRIKEDRVVVSVLSKPGLTTADIDENELRAFGVKIQAKAGHSMRVEIPISQLANVSNAVKELAGISLPLKPKLDEISEGVDSMNADNWQSWGYDGSGIKIAVIDGGFDGLTEAQGNGDIPASYVSHNFTGTGLEATTVHGTAVAEAIFDLVPGADFYFYKVGGSTGLENAIDSCINRGVDIINHSMSWYNASGYYDGTGVICDIADNALNAGILWVNSAGNSARRHYRNTFSDNGHGYHLFSGSDSINSLGPVGDGQWVRVYLNWDEYTYTDQDYDLYLARDTGNITPKWIMADSSINRQDGDGIPDIAHIPQERIDFQNPDEGATYGILVKNFSADGTADFTVFSLDQDFNHYVEAFSISDPGVVADVITVAAIDRTDYPSGPQEYFSSQGPTNDDRMKPDVAAPDNCDSYTYGHWFGTSLSSPHTAGICALIKSRYPSFSDTDTREYLYNNCSVDMGASGKDSVYGFGRIVMPELDITVTSPNGGENWYIDSTNNITWTSSGTSGAVQIEYSTNNGSSWSDVIASTTDDGSHPWIIPDASSENCLVRITDTIGMPGDTSDATFEISHPIPSITVTSPNGGEIWYIDSTYNITWTSFATSGGVQIEYSTNNGSNWSDVIASTTDDGSYPWLMIPDDPSTNCLVRITDTNGSVSDTSDAVFEIAYPYITITYPNGGDSLYADSSYDITWTTNVTSKRVRIEYSTNLGTDWSEIIASKPADTLAYSWTIPNTPSDNCLVRISGLSAGVVPPDVSDAAFTILPIPYITVTSPNGGENLYVDSTYDITWISEGTSDSLFIDYSIDNGTTWLEVTSYVPPDLGYFSWIIPNTPSDSCLIRIADSVLTQSPADTSDSLFTISLAPYITVTSPNGGEEWMVDSTYDITWATNLTTEGVRIEYSTDNRENWAEIIPGIPADTLAYAWTVPNEPTDSCFIRISDTTTGSLADTSDVAFTITPPVAVPLKIPTVYSMNVRTITTGNMCEIKYGLPERSKVSFDIYDIKGTKVKHITEENVAGFHSKNIDLSNNPAGVYFIRMDANGNKFTKLSKVVLIR